MTHSELVVIAARWIRTHRACVVVGTEFNVQGASETPDAIGWNFSGRCVVVECKTSLIDFRAESKKFYRRLGLPGMGCERWYMAPCGVIPWQMIPEKWGLIEVDPRGRLTVIYRGLNIKGNGRGFCGVDRFTDGERNGAGETAILVSILRQQHDSDYCVRRNLFVDRVTKMSNEPLATEPLEIDCQLISGDS